MNSCADFHLFCFNESILNFRDVGWYLLFYFKNKLCNSEYPDLVERCLFLLPKAEVIRVKIPFVVASPMQVQLYTFQTRS